MKAIVQDTYGTADVLELREIETTRRSKTTRCSCAFMQPAWTRVCGM